ncbi:M23 family metallopeptidase [Alteripontixanthobacter maritimus]|nr:M23 family metallopeptidase [Alteripontixanthobacter maritimus]
MGFAGNFTKRFAMGFAALAGATLTMGAAPAAAETAAVSVTSEMSAISSPFDKGDAKFAKMFAQWRDLDGGDVTSETAAPAVSVPSRMPLSNAALTSDYGMRTHPVLGKRKRHKGVDLAAPTGTPVYATADGIVERANWFSSYGLYVSLGHGANLQTRYAHMSRLAVSGGDRVKKGQIIGYVGSTGRSTGPHLHYEVRIAGKAVNPVPYMVESQAQQAFALAMAEGGRGGQ